MGIKRHKPEEIVTKLRQGQISALRTTQTLTQIIDTQGVFGKNSVNK